MIKIIIAVLFFIAWWCGLAAVATAGLRDAAHFRNVGQVLVPAAKIISAVEASNQPRLAAYRDGHRCSIGYGTAARSCRQVITAEQAAKARNDHLLSLDRRLQKSPVYRGLSDADKIRVLVFAYQRGYARGLAVVNATIHPRPHGLVAMIKSWGYHNRVNQVEEMIA